MNSLACGAALERCWCLRTHIHRYLSFIRHSLCKAIPWLLSFNLWLHQTWFVDMGRQILSMCLQPDVHRCLWQAPSEVSDPCFFFFIKYLSNWAKCLGLSHSHTWCHMLYTVWTVLSRDASLFCPYLCKINLILIFFSPVVFSVYHCVVGLGTAFSFFVSSPTVEHGFHSCFLTFGARAELRTLEWLSPDSINLHFIQPNWGFLCVTSQVPHLLRSPIPFPQEPPLPGCLLKWGQERVGNHSEETHRKRITVKRLALKGRLSLLIVCFPPQLCSPSGHHHRENQDP